ncbi:MAG: CDGSH iron-sulfur domain-containing protein [Phycisphaerales bacterium]|nr:CDGSH iron-sulfur domain-containing protein [Phycisphaerales bacterium]
MARMVRFDRDGPYKIEPGQVPADKPIWVCGCGLTKNPPFCDGSHKPCRNEQPGTLYVYDKDRATVVERRDDE